VRTLLIGADGQLGQELRQVYSDHDLIPMTHADMDVTDRKQTEEVMGLPGRSLRRPAWLPACGQRPAPPSALGPTAPRIPSWATLTSDRSASKTCATGETP